MTEADDLYAKWAKSNPRDPEAAFHAGWGAALKAATRPKRKCSYPPCRNMQYGQYCTTHRDQLRRGVDLAPSGTYLPKAREGCEFDGCTRPHHAKGLCKTHWGQRAHGDQLRPIGHPHNRGIQDPKKVAELYEAGMRVKDIAARFEVSDTTIIRHLREQGAWKPYNGLAPRAERIAYAERLLADGLSLTAVSKMAHLDDRWLRENYREYTWTREQVAEAAGLVSKFAHLEQRMRLRNPAA